MSNNRSKHAERANSAPSTVYEESMETDDVPSSSGGDIALSVEETNKLRIALGLKPLNVDDKGTKEKEQQKKKEDAEKGAKTLEIQARIEKAKKDREKNAKIAGKSLGEELAEEDEDDAASWVLKSRQMDSERKLAEKRSKAMEELDKAASDDEGPRRKPSKSSSTQATAKGLKVAHGIEDILDTNADSIILTLKDTPILDKYELNEDDDELENIQLVEKEKLKLFESRKKKKSVYDVFDEEKKSILPQYDDDVETKHKKSFVIDDSTINVYQKRVEQEAQKVMEGRKFVQYNLEMDKTFASEYLTQEEAAVKFKKTKKKTVKKKKIRQKGEDDEAADVNNNANNNIIIEDKMDIAPQDSGRKDHGSRSESVKLAKDSQKAQNDAERRQKNYELAKQKAEEETKTLINGRPEDDEDKALLKSLSKAREMAKPERKDPLAELAARVQASKQKKDVEMASASEDPNLLFTATTEFIKNIQPEDIFAKPKKKDKIKESELEQEISEDISEHETMLKAQQAKERKLKQEQEDKDSEMREAEEANEENEDENEEEDEDETDEPDVGSSVTAALQFLKSRVGVETLETYVGRKNDKTVEFDTNNDPAPAINLSYMDEFGRPLTQKEAFRQLSWKFHGKKPGKNKQAKRMRQMEQEKARMKMSNNDTPLMTVAKLQAEQERTQQPFVVLSGKPLGSTETSYSEAPKPKPQAEKSESTPAPKRPITTAAPTGSVMQGDFKEFKINAPKKPKT